MNYEMRSMGFSFGFILFLASTTCALTAEKNHELLDAILRKLHFLWCFHEFSMGSMVLLSRVSDIFLHLLDMLYRLKKKNATC